VPDVEKKKRRSARTYVPIGKVPPEELERELEIVAHYFPPDDDDGDEPTPAHAEARARTRATMQPDKTKRDISQADRKRLAREGKAVVNPDGHISYPIETVEDLHNAAELARSGHGDVAAARKLIRRRAKELGVANPLKNSAEKAIADTGNPHTTGADFNQMRVSPSRAGGQQSPSTGDHGAAFSDPMNQPGPRELAWRHPDLRQATTNPVPLFSMRTADDFPRDMRGLSSGVPVALDRLGADTASGLTAGPANPVSRRMDHQSRGSATPANGPHGMQPLSRAPMSMKVTSRAEALDILRRNARGEL
jgi:hypothetical protein